jgi:hypothetical protein
MVVEIRTLLHGVYIRMSGDTGQQVGAHVEYVERVVESTTGEVVSARLLPPEPLDLGPDALTPLIGEVVRVQQAELETLKFKLDELAGRLIQEQALYAETLRQMESELVRLRRPLDQNKIETTEINV